MDANMILMRLWGLILFAHGAAFAQQGPAIGENAGKYLAALIRLDTSNPPGNETRVAQYLKQIVEAQGIACELLGDDPKRLNFVARLKGSGEGGRPLLLMAHSDVVPADRKQWTVDPFSAAIKDGYMYGRGATDTKSLLSAELAVFLELKRRNVKLKRDVIFLSEADEEAGSLGIQWLIKHAYSKIDAEFAINEGGSAAETASKTRLFQIQTTEKIPTRVILTGHGTAGHGSLPRADNAVVHLARAITRLAEADQPVRLNTTTRRYLAELAKIQEYRWLQPQLSKLESDSTSTTAANQIRAQESELEAILRTTVSPTMLSAGMKINVIPNSAEAQVDVRRLPNETQQEVLARFRRIVNDPSVDVSPAAGQEMPATEPSSLTTALYKAMEHIFYASTKKAVVVPLMSRGATDGSFLRQKGMAVYGAPIFLRDGRESRSHGNDERIALENLSQGTELLWAIVNAVVR
jgi:acetylornithine deacetylase/succinyl-diaminopimelate desuccinylase-like protein